MLWQASPSHYKSAQAGVLSSLLRVRSMYVTRYPPYSLVVAASRLADVNGNISALAVLFSLHALQIFFPQLDSFGGMHGFITSHLFLMRVFVVLSEAAVWSLSSILASLLGQVLVTFMDCAAHYDTH